MLVRLAGPAALVLLAALGWMYRTALADPVVRHAELPLLHAGEARLRILLLSDIHVAGPDMPPARLRRLVVQLNALRPDLVLIAGDFVSDKRVATRTYPMTQAVAPLAALRSRWGTIAVRATTTMPAAARARGRRCGRRASPCWRTRRCAPGRSRSAGWTVRQPRATTCPPRCAR